MQRTLLALLLITFLIVSCKLKEAVTDPGDTTTDAELTIEFPNGSDSLMVGSTYDVLWSSTIKSNLVLEYSTDNGSVWSSISDSVANTGLYTWGPIPSSKSARCLMRIRTEDGASSDESDSTWSIIENTSKVLILTSPTGGEVVEQGGSLVIDWISSLVTSVLIEFSGDNGITWETVVTNYDATKGSYTWQEIPILSSTQCLIRISDVASPSISDVMTSNFTIQIDKNLLIISPNGGESIEGGTEYEVRWYSKEVSTVNLEYSINNGIDWNSIAKDITNTGIYYWNPVPAAPSTLAKLRITDTNNSSNVDVSDTTFSIMPEGAISISSPISTSKWLSGTKQFINWTSKNVANVKIEYSTNNGSGWQVITESTLSDGSFEWDPIPAHNSSLCNIRISDASDGYPSLIMSSPFTIYTGEEVLEVYTPNGGESWAVGSSQDITWFAEGIDNLKIELTTNNGQSWTTLANTYPNVGTYKLDLVPVSPSALCKIRLSDVLDSYPSDVSDKNFSIVTEQKVVVQSPNGGEQTSIGGQFEIKWFSTDVSFVKIEYTVNNGLDWTVIENSIPNTGSYFWDPIPKTPSNLAKIRITDTANSANTDESDGTFTIAQETQIAVIEPNGGEQLQAGSTTNIGWTSTNVENVKLEYTTNNGAVWTVIVESTPSIGFYSWERLPDITSQQCRVRVSDAQDGLPSDISDANFTITKEVVQDITIISPNGGEAIEGGTEFEISWISKDVTKVNIDYSLDNGNNWNTIVQNLPNTGIYYWNPVPSTPSTLAKLRISDSDNSSNFDISDSRFSILPEGEITITSPQATNRWLSGTKQFINWTSKNVANVKIEYSTNNGNGWQVITESTLSDGSFEWDPIPVHNSSLCNIRISDASDGYPSSIMSSPFTIYTGEEILEVYTPNGGESWQAGSEQQITWFAEGIDNIKIELTTNNGQSWTNLKSSHPNVGTYTLSFVPATPSALCKIRLSDALDSYPSDVSDNNFSIVTEQKVIVQSPNGGEQLVVGAESEIKWFATDVASVNIEYTINNGLDWTIVESNLSNTGVYKWNPVPNTPSNLARIRITDSANSANTDQSDGTFSITKESQIAVISPNGGEAIEGGTEFEITWFSKDVTKVNIEYSIDNGSNWNTIEQNLLNTGIYYWNPVPSTPSSLAKLRITDSDNSSNFDISDNTFSILPEGVITITSPQSGNKWLSGTKQFINWTSINVANVKIEYSTNNGNGWQVITESTLSDGSFEWDPIPAHNSSLCNIRISDASDGHPSSIMSTPFTIYTGEEVLEVYSPNGGESWAVGSSQDITWFAEGIDNIKIELTTNNGQNWTTLANTYPNVGTYRLNFVPVSPASLCKIRLSDAVDSHPSDVSDNNFSIVTEQKVIVQSPNGGEIVEVGTQAEIKWFSTDVSTVKIEYTINNGLDWTVIENSIPNTGSYYWEPVPKTPSNLAKIKISDTANSDNTDESDGTFTISQESQIAVLEPNGGEQLQAGTTTNIRWTSANVENVKIEYTTNNGAKWNVITERTSSIGFFVWEGLPDISSQQCRIRVSDAEDGIPSDISDANFTITNQIVEVLTITSPNGGEEWQSGVSQLITWQSSGVDSVKIEYSLNNGTSWTVIENSIENADAYSWNPVPNVDDFKRASKIRISDAEDGKPVDESNGTFTIKPIPSITLISPNGGEEYEFGETVTISWSSIGVERVAILATSNNGAVWDTLEASVLNTGIYNKGFSKASSEYKVQIRDAVTGSPSDESDGTFTVLPQIVKNITVTQPNGGENWLTSDIENKNYFEITWTSENVANVDIQYTLDGGANWTTIISDASSNGLYNWAIPATIQFRTDLAKVRILDATNENLFDVSDGFFSIHPQVKLLRIEQPFGEEYYFCPDDDPMFTLVTWTSAGISDVKIEYSYDNGSSWVVLTSSYPSSGAYSIPINAVGQLFLDVDSNLVFVADNPTTLGRIRITDVSAGTSIVPPADPDPQSDISELFNLGICPGAASKELDPNKDAIGRMRKN